jgi:hypothetical protein
MSETGKESESGRAFFGDKTRNYLEKKSRISVEKHTNTTLLYLQIDFERSRRNFYGEILVKAWVNPNGVKVNGIVNITEGSDIILEDIPHQVATLDFSTYISHLKELGLDPQIGDYFSTKNRVYMIYKRTIVDANLVSIATDQQAVMIKYTCGQVDDESLLPSGAWQDFNTTNRNEIDGLTQF